MLDIILKSKERITDFRQLFVPHLKHTLHRIMFRNRLVFYWITSLIDQFYRVSHSDTSFTKYNIFWETLRSPKGEMAGEILGGNFIDISLKVIVRGATDTVCAFKPQYLHGTTIPDPNLRRSGIIMAFSTHIKKAYLKSLAAAENGELMIRTDE